MGKLHPFSSLPLTPSGSGEPSQETHWKGRNAFRGAPWGSLTQAVMGIVRKTLFSCDSQPGYLHSVPKILDAFEVLVKIPQELAGGYVGIHYSILSTMCMFKIFHNKMF